MSLDVMLRGCLLKEQDAMKLDIQNITSSNPFFLYISTLQNLVPASRHSYTKKSSLIDSNVYEIY